MNKTFLKYSVVNELTENQAGKILIFPNLATNILFMDASTGTKRQVPYLIQPSKLIFALSNHEVYVEGTLATKALLLKYTEITDLNDKNTQQVKVFLNPADGRGIV